MKKFFIIVATIIITGCSNNKEKLNNNINYTDDNQSKIEENEVQKSEYIDTNPIKVGLYINGNLIQNFEAGALESHKEIATFEVMFTNNETIDRTNTKANFLKYYNLYSDISEYKIGFYISFEVNGEFREQLILGPQEMYSMTPYLYNYLYDDINQTESWYSHIENEDMNDNTIFSSIKLYTPQNGPEISSPITLTVFTYKDKNDFDFNNHYRGKSFHTVTINH